MDNIPGFPDGISGHKLLDAQIAAVRRVDDAVGYFTPAEVTRVERSEDGRFAVTFDWLRQSRVTWARTVILATGVVDRMPVVGGKIDPIFPWANQALVDFCVLCDGHTLPGKSVAVIGHDAYAVRTALDLLHFHPASVEILTHGHPLLEGSPEAERADLEPRLAEHRIPHYESEMVGFDGIREKRFHVRFADGSVRQYDLGFCALGWYRMNDRIPRSLGARFDADGFVVTDEDCRVLSAAAGEPIPGVYCVGDLRNGWNQIPEAWATAERAVIHAYSWYL